jgi:MerR family transcriptional regulator, light-induced transcriptional regulator
MFTENSYSNIEIITLNYSIPTQRIHSMVTSTSLTPAPQSSHRIGAVSALSGVPVPTLRVWQIRYATFSPRLSSGGQRLYCDDDVLRATLLKRLTELGHAISSIANQDAAQLNALLQQQNASQGQRSDPTTGRLQTVRVAVVGLGLAARLAADKFKKAFAPTAIAVTDIYSDLHAALNAPLVSTHSMPQATALSLTLAQAPQFLLVHVNSLHALVQVELRQLVEQSHIAQVIVLYRFGQEPVVESMRRAGMVVRREPVSDYELADLFRSSLLVDAPHAIGQAGLNTTIPPRKYDDATLARMAAISTSVLCECPRHVAEIIAQLVSFEQYSQECLNKSTEDARLHAYLHSVSGSARALFEHALEMVAEHEGLVLSHHPQANQAQAQTAHLTS